MTIDRNGLWLSTIHDFQAEWKQCCNDKQFQNNLLKISWDSISRITAPKIKPLRLFFSPLTPTSSFSPCSGKCFFCIFHFPSLPPSQELFYLTGAHKFPSQYHLTDFLCLPHNSLKRYSLRHQSPWPDLLQLSCTSRDSLDFVALPGCIETDCIFLAPSGKPSSLWGSKKAELQNLGGRGSQRNTKVHIFHIILRI